MNELTRYPKCESDHTQKVFLAGDWVDQLQAILVPIFFLHRGRKLDFDSWKCQQCLHIFKVPKDLGDMEAPTES